MRFGGTFCQRVTTNIQGGWDLHPSYGEGVETHIQAMGKGLRPPSKYGGLRPPSKLWGRGWDLHPSYGEGVETSIQAMGKGLRPPSKLWGRGWDLDPSYGEGVETPIQAMDTPLSWAVAWWRRLKTSSQNLHPHSNSTTLMCIRLLLIT